MEIERLIRARRTITYFMSGKMPKEYHFRQCKDPELIAKQKEQRSIEHLIREGVLE